jgi:ABC-2 type transport system ATP-binding protein
VEVEDLGVHRPTLDDVFLALTGHGAQSAEADADLEEVAA